MTLETASCLLKAMMTTIQCPTSSKAICTRTHTPTTTPSQTTTRMREISVTCTLHRLRLADTMSKRQLHVQYLLGSSPPQVVWGRRRRLAGSCHYSMGLPEPGSRHRVNSHVARVRAFSRDRIRIGVKIRISPLSTRLGVRMRRDNLECMLLDLLILAGLDCFHEMRTTQSHEWSQWMTLQSMAPR
jgi:hypothetical protein